MSAQAKRYQPRAQRGHGMTAIETAVMDLDDEGLSVAEIAATLDRSGTYVRAIVERYRFNPAGDRAEREAAARGSTELLRAQISSGQHFLSPAMATLLHDALRLQRALQAVA
ncbi:hypothetical protein [Sphingomonas sp. Leaf4]|uniref:hypothetical protein n=1 Tax=Sphingomonas sp. Leaf4 TaxID=2876553 RepID=UPI001E3C543A|nr:hypothetical protein [Sphingomonas sp. Leaf4]